jgi:hypothetical protein
MHIFTKNIANIVKTGLGLALIAVFLLPVASADAAAAKKAPYSGQITSSIAALTLKPSASATVTVSVKNTGTSTWSRTGKNFVSVYTYLPKYRASVFYDKSWSAKTEPALMKEKTVKPGASATFVFKMTAPAKTGTYQEGFNIAAENVAWIAGTQFTVPVTVAAAVAKAPVPAKPAAPVVVAPPIIAPATNNPQSAASSLFAATLMIKSFQDKVTVAGGSPVRITLGFKNVGTATWETRVLHVRDAQIAVAGTPAVSLADATWANALEPSRVREPISPGNIGYFDFNVMGPPSRGDYNLSLKLVVDDSDVPGATIDIPVTVTEDAPQLPTQEIPIAPSGTVPAAEPNIRVGLWNVPGNAVLLNSSPFTVVGSNGATLATIPANATITVGFNRESKTVVVSTASGQYTSPVPVRFVPTNANGLFQVPNFAGWTATAYVNQFRGTLELNYYQPNDNVWLIEELPLEQYLQGLGETSNDSAPEFQKALVTAARNYAYFVHSIGGKYALFDVETGAADQVYRAYGSETIRPNVVAAVQATAGQMVTYNNDIVVTPYFSRSDGHTRSWTDVWGGAGKPWLVSVPAPHDVGQTLWGHGVGMSASDALGWAGDGKTYDWILKYYYTGTVLKKIY